MATTEAKPRVFVSYNIRFLLWMGGGRYQVARMEQKELSLIQQLKSTQVHKLIS